MLIVAILTAKFPPDPDAGLTSASIASLTMIYLEAMSFNISWGPTTWIYIGEIFPNRLREAGVAIGTATQWLFNFVFSQVTPHAVENLGWKTFVMFTVFNWALVVFVWFFIKETKGRSLEEMEERKSSRFSSSLESTMLTYYQLVFGGSPLPDREPEALKGVDRPEDSTKVPSASGRVID